MSRWICQSACSARCVLAWLVVDPEVCSPLRLASVSCAHAATEALSFPFPCSSVLIFPFCRCFLPLNHPASLHFPHPFVCSCGSSSCLLWMFAHGVEPAAVWAPGRAAWSCFCGDLGLYMLLKYAMR
ncbi:uncharacterized protein [Triticum aestivum]|uniref:uncharacterized protein n=1 Tax=Triticum aestivum TaxID=4565 RepID=UPI001D01C75E|nr:uncharacterized protein LOC123047397 [Triticum aestivum]